MNAGQMRSTFLNFSPPSIGAEEISEVVDTLRSGWITTGPKVARFEREFAAFVGAPGALALSSATAALHLALVTLGIGPGDVVITTPMSFCSSAHVIEHVGARPLLVDVEADTLNIDPNRIRQAIGKQQKTTLEHGAVLGGRIKAILPVHLHGHPCDMEPILEIAGEHELAVVEDAAHALPARYKGRIIGSNSPSSPPVFTCFSFYATKNLTTGEGGMLIANPAFLDEARVWSLHGMSRDAYKRYTSEGSWFYEVTGPGFKYNMTDIQAAIGLHQLQKLPRFQSRRREIVKRYNAAFRQYEELQTPAERDDVEHAWHIYSLRLNTKRFGTAGAAQSVERNEFIDQLKARNIGASVHFIPIHLHPYYREKYGYKPADFPTAYAEYLRLLSLPLYPAMTDDDIDDVIQAVCDIVESSRR
ncbi:MAG TPA: DegT/DnrJ/EryC1/StrS aminotransferase family protein [bacterium]|nr:DegT/DnrJ/EryC1/StrS aminotransferase family protein [bacterium]